MNAQETGAVAPTGQWTVEVNERGDGTGCLFANTKRIASGGAQMLSEIADAHNAALVEEWRKGHAYAQAPALDRIEELHKQLAAERKEAAADRTYFKEEIAKLEQQLLNDERVWKARLEQVKGNLVDEREKLDNATTNCMTLSKLLYERTEQLAAEQEKVKALIQGTV